MSILKLNKVLRVTRAENPDFEILMFDYPVLFMSREFWEEVKVNKIAYDNVVSKLKKHFNDFGNKKQEVEDFLINELTNRMIEEIDKIPPYKDRKGGIQGYLKK